MSSTRQPSQKITISFDELHTPAVDERLRQQSALDEAAQGSQRAAATPSRLAMPDERERPSIWYNAFFNLTVFGLLGGLLAWGTGELVHLFNPNTLTQAREQLQQLEMLGRLKDAGRIKPVRYLENVELIRQANKGNPWFEYFDQAPTLPPDVRKARQAELEDRDRLRNAVADICFYCACGTLIALALGMAESVAARNAQAAIMYGSIGALLGLVGGIVVYFVAEWLYKTLGGGRNGAAGADHLARQIVARALAWGILGLFMSAAPGLVMRNTRKLLLGLIGGFAGGIVGGALFDPIHRATNSDVLSRLVAVVSIGVITGVGTALVESVAKQGWLRVVKGLIAGKQFIVYRNPTFIGSSPQCEIYLFKDPHVGRRHAAVYVQRAGYEIEDLGTGWGTTINGRLVRRARLRNGDRLQIGDTAFTFQEKPRN